MIEPYASAELIPIEDEFAMSEEEERDFWSGKGGIVFHVEQNISGVFEIEVLDYWGCAGGMQDTLGIEYYIEHEWGLTPELKEGVIYKITNLNVEWTRGDGWTTDDDVEYYFDDLIAEWKFWSRTKRIVHNLWWQNVGWRIRSWWLNRQNT